MQVSLRTPDQRLLRGQESLSLAKKQGFRELVMMLIAPLSAFR